MQSIKQLTLALIAGLGFAANTFAAPITFTLTAPDSRQGVLTSEYAQQYNYTIGGVNLNVTGWSYGSVTTCTSYSGVNCTSTSTTDAGSTTAHQDFVGNFGTSYGVGVEIANTPNHAIDSQSGDFDMLLFTFSEAVSLNSVDLGWILDGNLNRSDVSILAGTSNTFSSPLNKTWQSLVGNGWQSAGNYNNLGSNSASVNSGNISSKYWLIGAYNSAVGTPIANNDSDYEAFKLQAISVSKVPESSALALFCIGFLGLIAVRRRNS